MKWTKIALTTMTLATLGLCFTACDDPPSIELDSEAAPESELMRDFHVGTFELDGNIATDAQLDVDDWDLIEAGQHHSIATTGIVVDPPKGTIFTGGGSKDTLNIGSWRYTSGSVPDKNNITDAYAAAYIDADDPSGLNIYFGADRFATSGDAFLGFWFFQDSVTTNPNGTFGGTHKNDDLLVLVNFEQGGSAPNIQVLVWDTTAPNNLRLLYEDQAECTSGGVLSACAITNDAAIEAPWPYTPKSGPAGTIPVNAFFEGGVELTDLFPNTPPCFASFMAETRASTSVSATLKDFVVGSFQACQPGLEVTAACEDVELVSGSGGVSFVVNYEGTIENTSTGPAGDMEILSLTGPEGSTPTLTDTAENGENVLAPGDKETYSGSFETTSINSTDPGSVTFGGKVTVEAKGVAGELSRDADFMPVCSLCP